MRTESMQAGRWTVPGMLLLCCIQFSCGDDPIHPPERGPEWVSIKRPDAPLLSNRVNDIYPHRNGQIWIATDSGAAYYEYGSWGVIDEPLQYTMYVNGYPPTYVSSKVNCITAGKDGSVWFGLAGGGLRRYLPGAEGKTPWLAYRVPEISYNVISSICCEEVVDGDVWVTTFTAGANRFVPSATDPRYGAWRAYTVSNVPEFGTNILQSTRVQPFNRSVWIASQMRLAVYLGETGGWRQVEIPPPYNSTVVSIAFDSRGRVWLGKVDGVSFYDQDAGDWTHFTHANTGDRLPAGRINAVAVEGTGLRWFGTNEGLVRFQDTTWFTFDRSTNVLMSSDTVTSLTYDRSGNLWIGTSDGALVYKPGGTVL